MRNAVERDSVELTAGRVEVEAEAGRVEVEAEAAFADLTGCVEAEEVRGRDCGVVYPTPSAELRVE